MMMRLRRWAFLTMFVLLLAACEDDLEVKITPPEAPEPPRVCPTTLSFGEDASWALTSETCDSGLGQAYLRVGYSENGVEYFIRSNQYPDFSGDQSGDDTFVWTLSGDERAPDLRVVFQHQPADGTLIMTVSVSAPTNRDVTVTRVEPMRMEETSGINLAGLSGGLHWYHHGYDPWAHTAVEILNAADPLPRRDGSVIRPSAGNREWYTTRPGTGWWVAAGRVPAGNTGFVTGALSARVLKTYFAAHVVSATDDRVTFDFVMGTPGDALRIPAGSAKELDPVYVQLTGDMVEALDAYGRHAAEVVPPLVWHGTRPRGWSTWYDYFADVTVQDVRTHIGILSEPPYSDAGYNVVQIDDGYEKAWGDWDENDEFAAVGMDGLADEIAAAGLTPGIWIAPFMVAEDLDLVTDHPDWFVHRADGSMRLTGDPIIGQFACLDVTNPDAETFLRQTIRRFVDDGYTYLKLDFLYAGAVEGTRFDNAYSALEAYDHAMQVIEDEAGPDVFLLASGQPFLPTAGHVHAARTSDDIIVNPWDTTNYRMSGIIARYNAARFWSEHLFLMDADNLAVRGRMSDDEAYATALSNLLGGQNLFLGDDLSVLPEDRQALLVDPDLLSLLDEPGPTKPLDLFDKTMRVPLYFSNQDWVTRENRTPAIWIRGHRLAVINFESTDLAVRLDVADLADDRPQRVKLTDSAGTEQRFGDVVSLSIPARTGMLYRIDEIQ